MGIFQNFGHLVASVGLLVFSFFGHSQGQVVHNQLNHVSPATTSPVATQQVSQQTASVSASDSPSTASSPFYTAARSISQDGHTIYISVHIPKSGGDVTGKISGDCSGDITGQYDGKDKGSISGQAQVSCKYLFMQLPGTATFNGIVSKPDSDAQLFVTLDANSAKISRNVFVPLN